MTPEDSHRTEYATGTGAGTGPGGGPLPPAQGQPLQLRLLGTPAWRRGNGDWQPLGALDAAAAAVLALEGPCDRDTLAGRLWPGGSHRGAPNNLRQHVSRLQRQMGAPLFATGGVYRLLEDVQLDIGPPGQALAPEGPDDLLAGCDFGRSEWLQEWVAAQRLQLRTGRALQLMNQAETHEQAGDLPAALALAWRATAQAPLHEAAWRQLMRLYYLQGNHTSAIEAFERFEALLRDQTGARPGPETLHLLATIEQAGAADLPRRRLPASLLRPPRCVGRQAAWQAMHDAWAEGRAFLLQGEAGMGKSRLLEDFAAGRAGLVFERARPGDAHAAYNLLARVLRAVLCVSSTQPQGYALRELSRLLPELGSAPAADADETRLRAAIESLLLQARAATTPLRALLLDDLQFADLASLETLRWLSASRGLAGLQLGLATRPIADGALRALVDGWLVDSHRPLLLPLQPLPTQAVAELLATLALPGFAAEGLAQRLVAHTGGHPLFLLETLKEAWLRAGPAGAGTTRDVAGAWPRPASVQALIESRLRELPPAAAELLYVAAVAGDDFDAPRAAALLRRSLVELMPAWNALERAQVLQGNRFTHELMHECAAALVPAAVACPLHAMLAELLQADASVAPARIATHWQAAERPGPAGVWWQRAAAAARLAGRLQEQQSLLERAAACHRLAGAHDAEFDCVRDSLHSGRLRHGAQPLLAALPRLQALVHGPRQQLDLLLLQAEAVQGLDRHAECLELAQQAEAIARALDGMRLADALGLQGVAQAHLGRNEQALALAQRAVSAAADTAQRLTALRAQAYALYALSRLGQALPVQRQVLALAAELGDETEAVTAEVSLAALLASIGDNADSLAHARAAAQRAQVLGLMQDSALAEVNQITLGMAAAATGRFDLAVPALETALQLAGPGSPPLAQAKARNALARVRLWLGDGEVARALVETLPSGTSVHQRMQAALILAQADQMAGRSGDTAWARLDRLGAENPGLPLMLSGTLELSYSAAPEAALARLRPETNELHTLGLPGAAHALALRQVDCLLALAASQAAAPAQAAALAAELLPQLAAGRLHAKVYPVEAWWVLWRAFSAVGQAEAAAQCQAHALKWLRHVRLPVAAQATLASNGGPPGADGAGSGADVGADAGADASADPGSDWPADVEVPDEARARFLARNPCNRALLEVS